MGRSQPLSGLLSQLAKPLSQVVTWQLPVEQLELALDSEQEPPQVPQLLLVLVAVSQPLSGLPSQDRN
jgi:hypothetical protein